MVKITVEGELDTILSTRTETVTTTVVNQSQFYTLTTTTVEVTSRSAPSFPPLTPPAPPSPPSPTLPSDPAPNTPPADFPATPPLVFGQTEKPKPLRKARKAKAKVFYPPCFSGVYYTTFSGESWIFPPPGSTEAREFIKRSSAIFPLALSIPLPPT